MRIAVASKDRRNVDEHFGKADSFMIFELEATGAALLMERKVTPLSVGDPDHPFDERRFGSIAEALKGCQRVYVTKIGERPAAELAKLGIEPVIYAGPIRDIKKQ